MPETELFNFKDVDAAEGSAMGGKYLNPGMYRVSLTESVYGESSKKNTPYMEITYQAHSKNPEYDGKIGKAKFYLTASAMSRLQYLHTAFFGKKLEKTFKSTKEIAEYFEAIFKSESGKKIIKPCIIAGSISADSTKLYSDLPYSGFVIDENEYEEGAFEINSVKFKAAITSDNKFYRPDSPSSNEDFITPEEDRAPKEEKAPWD